MDSAFVHPVTGKIVSPRDADYERMAISALRGQYSDLLQAVVDLQNRMSRMDGEALQWPGDTYEPRHTEPA